MFRRAKQASMREKLRGAKQTPPSSSAKADDPVRGAVSVKSLNALEYWVPAFAGDDDGG